MTTSDNENNYINKYVYNITCTQYTLLYICNIICNITYYMYYLCVFVMLFMCAGMHDGIETCGCE